MIVPCLCVLFGGSFQPTHHRPYNSYHPEDEEGDAERGEYEARKNGPRQYHHREATHVVHRVSSPAAAGLHLKLVGVCLIAFRDDVVGLLPDPDVRPVKAAGDGLVCRAIGETPPDLCVTDRVLCFKRAGALSPARYAY